MADLSGITAVRPTSTTITRSVKAGATCSIGQTVQFDTTDNEQKLADASAQATARTTGIVMTSGVDGGYMIIATGGEVELVGASMTIGDSYVQSATAGGIAPEADLTTNDWVTNIGRAKTATQISLRIQALEVQVA